MGPQYEITIKNLKTDESVTIGRYQFVSVKKEGSETMSPQSFRDVMEFLDRKERVRIQAWSGAKGWDSAL